MAVCREDKNQFINLPLINTLRDNSVKGGLEPHNSVKNAAKADDEEGTKEGSQKPIESTIPNPPSFYYDDIEKWNKKFAKHIRERDNFKRQFQKTQEMSCLTKNTNIKSNDDIPGGDHGKKHRKGASVGEDNKQHSLFNQVLKRRKSR